ncbi:MAG: lysophospholipase [Gammaproteobacteria bacterium]|nr:lysophospholipase [Gammaproteobacteria bacterium]
MKRWLAGTLLLILIILLGFAPLMTPERLTFDPQNISVNLQQRPDDPNVIPGTEERVSWFHDDQQRTSWVVVAIHGFSATRQETAPLAEMVALSLEANLFEARLKAHGLRDAPMVDASAEDWLNDTARALATGAALGDKLVVIGTSTGATLAMSLLSHELMQRVDTLVLISPNFAPRDSNAQWLTRPYGPILADLIAGKTRSWQAHNALQAKYWSTTYPTTAAVEMMRTVDRANAALPASVSQRVLLFYSPDDQVVSTTATLAAIDQIDAREKRIVPIKNPGDPSHHVLAGDILSPGTTAQIATVIAEFTLRPAR